MPKIEKITIPKVGLLAVALLAFAQRGVPQPVPPMAVGADPSFEVATIKPARPDEQKTVQVQGTRLFTADTSLVDLMMFAYGVHPLQITGGPDWIRTQKFDLLMQPDLPGRPSTAQMRSILRKLLADRFNLLFHHAQKELPVYRIIGAKGGPRLTPTASDSAASNTAFIGFPDGAMFIGNATMAEFASLMQRYVGLERPIVDHTGISGKYDFKLSWTPDPSQFDGRPPWPITNDASAPPGLYTAIQEQLGLKLQPAKELADVLVIDRVEQPSKN